MNRQFLVSTSEFTSNSTIFEIPEKSTGLNMVPTFTDRNLNLNVSLNALCGTLPFCKNLTWMILEITIQTAVLNGHFEQVNRLVMASREFAMYFYKKYIEDFRGETERLLRTRMSRLFESLFQTVVLFKNQPTFDGHPVMPVLTMVGSSVLNDWHLFVPWPFSTPTMIVKPKGVVYSDGEELDIYDVQTGDLHLDEVWMSGEEGKDARFKANFFKTPNVVFQVIEQLRKFDIPIRGSIAINVWVRFLKAFLGQDAGVYLGSMGMENFVCNEYIL